MSRATGASSSTHSKPYQTPTQNFAYADVDGDIGFISPGLLPTRKSGDGSCPSMAPPAARIGPG